MEREPELLALIAARPEDRTARGLYADWLLDQGDPRGEVISLGLKGELSLTERRRVLNLTARLGRRWLGPVGELVDHSYSRFEGGFPVGLTFQAAPADERWVACGQDPRLATVKSVHFPGQTYPGLSAPMSAFLRAGGLKGLAQVTGAIGFLEELSLLELPFRLEALGVSAWGTFRREQERMFWLTRFAHVATLGLLSEEFINGHTAREIRSRIAGPLAGGAPARFERVSLISRYGNLEGVVAWLTLGPERNLLEQRWSWGQTWSISYLGVRYTLVRSATGFDELKVDPVTELGTLDLGPRLATAFAVVSQLRAAALRTLDVVLPEDLKLTAGEKDELRAAARRLRGVTSLRLGGQPFVP